MKEKQLIFLNKGSLEISKFWLKINVILGDKELLCFKIFVEDKVLKKFIIIHIIIITTTMKDNAFYSMIKTYWIVVFIDWIIVIIDSVKYALLKEISFLFISLYSHQKKKYVQ